MQQRRDKSEEFQQSVFSWGKSVFLRDMDITTEGFLYFLVAFSFYFISVEFILLSFVDFLPEGIEFSVNEGIIFIVSIVGSLAVSGFIVDKFKDRMRLLLISAFMMLVGSVFMILSDSLFKYVAISMIMFFSGLMLIDLLTILTHESTILNRGRLLAYILCISALIGGLTMLCTLLNPIAVTIVQAAFFVGLIYVATKYSYVETEERLKSDLNFGELFISSENPILGYLTSFIVLGFVLGNSFPFDFEVIIDPLPFVIVSISFLILAGVLMDKRGRKWSYVGGILVLSGLIIFAGIFKELYNAVFFGIAIPIMVITVCVFAGDFSTERNAIRYRGRLAALFLFSMVLGVLGGIVVKYLLIELYESSPVIFYWIPSLINGINSLLLIVILVWIMPLPEVLSAKEANWADKIKNLYVFNRDSICLYNESFTSDEDSLELPPEDLITGGLTGILTLISEITNEKKNLRIIDKDRIKIYFAYGKHIIVTLISTQFLPILFKKLDQFTNAFEEEFEHELNNFKGKINPFIKRGEMLVRRYFTR